MNTRATFKNKAHQSVYDAGAKARAEGRPRFSPYGADDRTTLHFRKAWLAGYDEAPEPARGEAPTSQETDKLRPVPVSYHAHGRTRTLGGVA